MKKLSISKKPKKSHVIECASRLQERMITVPSQSNPALKYNVRYENQEGKLAWSCTCPAFMYRKPGQTECKHVSSVKAGAGFCKWKSSVGPEEQTKPGICPRCKGKTVEGRTSS
jgi:hypothetical protein